MPDGEARIHRWRRAACAKTRMEEEPWTCAHEKKDRLGSEMAQHEPVARTEALYRNEWPGIANYGSHSRATNGSPDPAFHQIVSAINSSTDKG